MTEPHETPDEYGEAVNRWLSVQHRHLVDHLDATLDVEAGLQDILLHSQHAALVERLDTEIDIETNLDAILSSEKKSTYPETAPLPNRQSTESSTVSTVSAGERIVLRMNLAVRRAYRNFLLGIALDLGLRLTHDLTRADARAHGARALVRALRTRALGAREFTRVFVNALDRAIDRDRPFTRAFTRALDRTLARDREIALARARSRALARALARAIDLDLDLDLDLGRALDLDEVLHSKFDLDRPLLRNLVLVRARDLNRDLNRRLVSIIDLEITLNRAREIDHALTAVGEYLNRGRQAVEDALGCRLPSGSAEAVRAFLDDFTDADLSGVELNGIELTGVCWSESGTRWPSGMDTKALKQRSTSRGNGIWVVGRSGGQATVPDSVGVS